MLPASVTTSATHVYVVSSSNNISNIRLCCKLQQLFVFPASVTATWAIYVASSSRFSTSDDGSKKNAFAPAGISSNLHEEILCGSSKIVLYSSKGGKMDT